MDKAEKYRDIARDIHDYINTTVGVAWACEGHPISVASLLEAIDEIDLRLEKIWLD